MRLLIVSHMPHYRRADGRVVGWGPTVQELDHLATRFSSVRHIACLHEGHPPDSALPYAEDRVELIPVRPSGGDHLVDKFSVLREMPSYISAILRELPDADMVHIRCPANVPMFAAILLPFVRTPKARWIKYAGNWKPETSSSIFFAFQRWWLSRSWHRGIVTVNGRWPDQPDHVRTFFNPSLTREELETSRRVSQAKVLSKPVRLMFAGRLEREKGIEPALRAFADVVGRGIVAHFDIFGDGPDRAACEVLAERLGVSHKVTFHGWLPRTALPEHYARAHLMLFPSISEGWPKILSEGMAYGVVPIAGAVGSIPQYLSEFAVGVALANAPPSAFADAVVRYVESPERWQAESELARQAASKFSYDTYLASIDQLLGDLHLTTSQ